MSKDPRCCRVCLQKTERFISLSSIFRLEPPQLSYTCIFNVATRLSAANDDELPQQLCSNCIDDLLVAFNFTQLAQESDKKLRQFNTTEQRQTRSRKLKLNFGKENILEQMHSERTNATVDYLEGGEQKVNVELIECVRRDPLEETDDEIESQCSNKEFNKETLKKNQSEDDDDDDKPLKELFKNVKSLQSKGKSSKGLDGSLHYRRLDHDSHEADNDIINHSASREINDFVPSLEAQIFPKGRYECKECANSYFTSAGLKIHSAIHLPNIEKIKKSQKQKKKKSKGDIVVYSYECNSQNTIKRMEEKSLNQSNPENKSRKEKQPKPKKMFPCHVCGKHMISASKLRYHMVMHTGEKDFLCTMCPKAYSTIYALKHHMRTHTGERPYECKFCGDRFTRPTTLKSHMRRHTGERPYGCDICGKRFIQHSSMTTHMKLNHMAKTIPCPHCDKKYARQTDLTTHLLSHTGDKPFSCQLCPSRFIRQANLNKHMNQHHHPSLKTGRVTNRSPAGSIRTQASTKRTIGGSTSDDLESVSFVTQDIVQPFVSLAIKQPVYRNLASTISNISNLSKNILNENNNGEMIGNIESIRRITNPLEVLSEHQVILNRETISTTSTSTLLGAEHLNRTMEEINRWSWPSNTA